ncbi:hypothetical protein CHY_0251 [Carboxydothermus hydrogenoformans Z-2901]|uniref:Uncharacterized protein n=1 Tax=Carboxydothermus hydrogenoformans (strain ATCC BAA-161 / DSM 6008 / Z-2901) TaxID=246194 RepID=Q3AFG1_CARHZ|nr:hypothetical protein CHY_0251 [Carboxydothermus hydrogenoformans Z-2901]
MLFFFYLFISSGLEAKIKVIPKRKGDGDAEY